ncbi:TetR/AcrR family transcriptional regulator [Nocardiopsis sp. CA-288880]|uniref:TetR/AcrR family transcriptional regulator n=1 Tax=Nocardiopsis sp. CA-288880 TaxID=3239995 RepID=UPI003D9996B0
MQRPVLRDHVAAGILDAAAPVLAERGDAVSMASIAEAAGVGRATLYRYFPNREALVAGMVERALDDLGARIADARVDSVPVPEGIARLVRAFLAEGRKYAAVVQLKPVREQKARMSPGGGEERVSGPLRALVARGVADGTLRSDVPEDVQFEMFTALVERALGLVLAGRLGAEEAGAVVGSAFLEGFRGARE